MIRAFVGLGSNLEDPRQQLLRAYSELATLPGSHWLHASALYRSPPMGPADQPDYINACVELETALDPLALLRRLQGIENLHRRVRLRHWGERTLDLDLLLYGDQCIAAPDLQVPHPGLAQRAFVLAPLAELDRQLQIPGLGPLDALMGGVNVQELIRLDRLW